MTLMLSAYRVSAATRVVQLSADKAQYIRGPASRTIESHLGMGEIRPRGLEQWKISRDLLG